MRDYIALLKLKPLYWKVVVIILFLEAVDEFVDSKILIHFGVQPGTFYMHFIKWLLTLILVLPLVWFWLNVERHRLTIEQRLTESETNYASLFQHNPDAIYVCDSNGKFLSANPAFEHLTGFNQGELIRLEGFPFVSEPERLTVIHQFELALQGMPVRFETTISNRFGTQIDLDVTYVPMYRNGEVVGLYGIAQDITSRKRAERELRDAQEIFDSFLDNTSDAIVILDSDRKVLRLNRGFEQMYGWTSRELVGQALHCLIPDENLSEMNAVVNNVLQGSVSSSVEAIHKTKSKQLFDVSVTVSPIKNSDGHVVGLAWVSRDVSEKRQLMSQLQETTNHLQSIITHAADAISIVDAEGKIVLVNPAWERIYGWTQQEIIAKPSPTETNFATLKEIQEGPIVCIKRRIKNKNGQMIDVSVTASPIFSPKGVFRGSSFISKDMSDYLAREERIRQTEKLAVAGELAAGIAHEIRNPLTSIKGFLQLLQSNYNQNYVEIMLEEVERINSITTELLLLSKPQGVTYEKVCISDTIQSVLLLMEAEANMHGVRLSSRIESNLPPIRCVESQIKQIFINLVKNSIEAMPKGGNVFIHAVSTGNGMTVSVEDDGPGIARERLGKLGEPFYTTKQRGTGLGLMVTYRIVQNYHGTIHVSSIPDRGTKFDVFLPTNAQHRTERCAVKHENLQSTDRGRLGFSQSNHKKYNRT